MEQALNQNSRPHLITTEKLLRAQAEERLLREIRAGRDSVRTEADWVSEEEMLKHFGIKR